MTDHGDFEGLAAGYALHALEPEDEQRLAIHLMSCQSCARLVADTAALGAAFADLVVEVLDPPPGLRERIMAAAAAEPREPMQAVPSTPAPPVVSYASGPVPDITIAPQRRRTSLRRLQLRGKIAVGVLAAAVGIGVAVPVTWAVTDTSRSTTTNSALAQWLLEPDAREVTLKATSGNAIAKAVMTDKGVYLLAEGLPVNDRSSIYVLWAGNGKGARAAVATFDVRGRSPVQLTATKLPMKTSDISTVAISYEPGRKAPSNPSDVVLSGVAA